uniref:Secreted protein n=1 Tax=Lutzomyia longipalpis TaxID=7200 RepID=A0A7G3B5B2_LUTLO
MFHAIFFHVSCNLFHVSCDMFHVLCFTQLSRDTNLFGYISAYFSRISKFHFPGVISRLMHKKCFFL